MGLLYYYWGRGSKTNDTILQDSTVLVTVLVVVRNEASNILNLLNDLNQQNYPSEYFQVIIVDDGSEDETVGLARAFQSNTVLDLQIESLARPVGYTGSPKKLAIAQGVAMSKGEWIICTDGDCRLPVNWISNSVPLFRNPVNHFVSGSVKMAFSNTWWGNFEQMEFAALIGIGGASINAGFPLMCNGANMAFRKSSFLQINGYKDYDQVISGDDQFLLHKMLVYYGDGVRFNANPNSKVTTIPTSSFHEFVQQRKRWAGKWRHSRSGNLLAAGLLVFMSYAIWIASFVSVLLSEFNPVLFGLLILAKVFSDYIFLRKIQVFLGQPFKFVQLLINELFYPWYALVLGLMSQNGGFFWKGRRFLHKSPGPSKVSV